MSVDFFPDDNRLRSTRDFTLEQNVRVLRDDRVTRCIDELRLTFYIHKHYITSKTFNVA